MRIKRILFTLLVAVMMFSLVAFASAAEEDGYISFDVAAEVSPSAVLSEDALEIAPGSEITLTLKVTESCGVSMIQTFVNFDADKVAFVEESVVVADEYGAKYTLAPYFGSNEVRLTFQSNDAKNYSLINTLVTFKLKLADDFHGNLSDVLSVTGKVFREEDLNGPMGRGSFDAINDVLLVHNFGDAEVTEPGCVVNGSQKFTCVDCDDYYTVTTDATGHFPGDAVTENVEPSTCVSNGSHDVVKYCTVCNTELERETVIDPFSGHSWLDATCTAPKTCTLCSATEGEALGHTWVDADCTTAKTCSTCNVTEGSALGHDWAAATCTDPRTCRRCSLTEGAALGHTPVDDPFVEPGCINPGFTAGSHCGVCNEVLVPQTQIPASDHSPLTVPAVKPDCVNVGYKAGTKCQNPNCELIDAEGNAWILKPEEIPALGHDITGVEVTVENRVEATCLDNGSYNNVKRCKVCNAVVESEKVVITAPGHTEVIDPYVKPGCETVGKTEGSHCSVCNAVIIAQMDIRPDGHFWQSIDETPATCTDPGYTQGRYCPVCETWQVGHEVIPALGHSKGDVKIENTIKPDCVNAGSHDEVYYCTRCSIELERTSVVDDALGHKPGLSNIENRVDATCTEDGSHDIVYYCTVCDVETSRTTKVDAALGHTEGEPKYENRVEPTCLDQGKFDTVVYCTVCDAELSRETTNLPSTGHNPDYPVEEKRVEATCTTKGSYDSVRYCTVCGLEASRETIEIKELGHSYGQVQVEKFTDSTCVVLGSYDNVKYCLTCKVELERETIKIDLKEHTKGEVKVENNVDPACTVDGSYDNVVYCTVCNGELSRDKVTVPMTGHTEVTDAAVAPTCTTTGLTEGTHCSVCEEVLVKQDVVKELGHTVVVDAAVAPACLTTGLTEGSHCSVCEEILVKQDVVPALGHTTAVDAAVAPTCTVAGLTEGSHCSVCEEILVAQSTVPSLGHTEVIDAAVAPTCTATGLTEGIHCSVCEEVLVKQDVVPALGHTYVEATCTSPKHCSVCEEEFEPALGHKFGDWTVTLEATVEAEGKKERTCSVCNSKEYGVVPKLPVITDTEEKKWKKGGDEGLVFSSNANFADFEKVLVDGVEVAAENYTVVEGSTVVTLSPEYLETLEKGDHTISIVSANGTAEASFQVAGSNMWWIVLIIIAAVAIVGAGAFALIFVLGKKRS